MEPVMISREEACRFLLLWHGLLGEYRFAGQEGVLDFIRQAGCIQFDPIDVCGKNAELVLQSRVSGFTRGMLNELLYTDRKLIDYFDKNLAILLLEDWPYLRRIRKVHYSAGRSRSEVDAVCDEVKRLIRLTGPLCSADIGMDEVVSWYWSDTRLSRAALETLYFRGELIVHHKKGTIKYYDLAENHIPHELLNAPDPLLNDFEYLKWRVLRRISSVGLLWNKPSDAWLYIAGFRAENRKAVFDDLMKEGSILPVAVEGIRQPLYCTAKSYPMLHLACSENNFEQRTELIAPLDNLMWDRNLIQQLFGFTYRWEIYTPQAQRKYGYYVLPVLSGERFIGRVEIVRKTSESLLEVKNLWLEPGVIKTGRVVGQLNDCFARFAKLNKCTRVESKL